MIDGREKRNGHLAFELQNSHVCEKRSKLHTPKSPEKTATPEDMIIRKLKTKQCAQVKN